MRKVLVAAAGAVALLFLGTIVWNAEAAPLSGLVGTKAGNALMEMVTCDAADDLCEKGQYLSCYPGGPGLECACQECSKFDSSGVLCPRKPSCNCAPGTTCQDPVVGNFCKCPR
jgi:hypothetical protein